MNCSSTSSLLRTSLACLMVIGLAYSCSTAKKQPDAKNTTAQGISFDSVQRAAIEEMIGSINIGLRQVGAPQKLAYPLYNAKDTLLYWIVDGNSARISIEWEKGDEVIWPSFFVKDGDLVYVRYRYVNYDTLNARAFESLIYLKEGKIVHCMERGKNLKKGEVAGSLMSSAHTKSTRSYEEVEADYKEYWKMVKEHMEKNGALPDFLKE